MALKIQTLKEFIDRIENSTEKQRAEIYDFIEQTAKNCKSKK